MNYRIIKINKIVALLFVFILSLNSFGAVVSDNDGAAFITKAEFDSLKNNFQAQIDAFNTSIDSKIDNAISAYLAGVSLGATTIKKRDASFDWTFPIICMNNSEWNDVTSKYYDYELPNIKDVVLTFRGSGNNPKTVTWNTSAQMSAGNSYMSVGNSAVTTCKTWYVIPEKYNELIRISDTYQNRKIGGVTFKAYEITNVGKGRHETEDVTVNSMHHDGHIHTTIRYWGYPGIVGIGTLNSSGAKINGGWATVNPSTFANWQVGTWTRKGGDSISSSIGWGAQTLRAMVLPSDGLTLEGARTWATTYCGSQDGYNNSAITRCGDTATRVNSFSWDGGSNIRQWVYTGNSDAPATSVYGWYFDMVKPQTVTEKFEGYFMGYMNDIAMTVIGTSQTWYGFNPWIPHWYWRYKAGGSIGTSPSTSEFSKLPAKQVFYYDEDGKVHYLDEGLFLFNLKDHASEVEFSAKWEVIDTSLPSGQKIKLKISSTPFDSTHDNNRNLKYKVNNSTATADQEVNVGDALKISVECDDSVEQLYMMWEPVTSGAYLGLLEISDFIVTLAK